MIRYDGLMPRQKSELVDLRAGTARSREGTLHSLRDVCRGEGVLYYAHAITNHARIQSVERWVLASRGWVVNRFHTFPTAEPYDFEWYVDLDHIEVDAETWRIDDRFLDVIVHECAGYELLDADELADGIEQGELSQDETLAVLRDLHALTLALPRLGFSGRALLERYAPGLPLPGE